MHGMRVLPEFERFFIADADALRTALPTVESEDVIALDIEMGQRVERKPGGYSEWTHILALVQIAAGSKSIIIDPLRVSIEPLTAVLSGHARKVFLGGGQDAGLLAKAGMPPLHIVDVGEVALALYGRREDGMAALARRIYGLSLDKTIRRTDWMARPLNPTLLAYAHRDAELTLDIYRWFEQNHPEIVRMHERLEFEPVLPPGAPEWLKAAVTRSQLDAVAIVMEHGYDPVEAIDELAAAVQPYIATAASPRLANRVLRVIGDLRLRPLLPDVLPFVDSPSSLLRASAARALGQISTPERAETVLESLLTDPIEDVRKAAASGLRELRTPRGVQEAMAEEEDPPVLDSGTLSALEQLKAQLEAES